MKTTNIFIFALMSISFCAGEKFPLLSKNLWSAFGGFLEPKGDKKLSMIHQKFNKISAYENVKEKLCPKNQKKWGFLKHSETEEIIIENDSQILPWSDAVIEVDRFYHKDDEMPDFIRCMANCLDLSELLVQAVYEFNGFLIESLLNSNVRVKDEAKDYLKSRDVHGRTPLLDVCWYTGSEKHLIRAQVRLGSDVNAEDNHGWSALNMAARNGNVEAVKLFIKKGAEKDARNFNGHTALHTAILSNEVEVAQILIEAGARTDVKTKSGDTALDIAQNNSYIRIVDLLRKKEKY